MGEVVNPALTRLKALGVLNNPAPAASAYPTQGTKDPRTLARQFTAHADSRVFRGSLRDISALVPEFERRPLAAEADRAASAHPHLDVVMRRAGPGVGLLDVPVGVVTRRHQLVPHGRVLQGIERALGVLRVDPSRAPAELELGGFGARLSLAVDLPETFDFDPGDGQRLGLRLLCSNSVSSGGLRLLMTWRRRASDSAIAVGTSRLEYRLAHRLPARLVDIVPSVQKAVELAHAERAALAQWAVRLVSRDALAHWADGAVRRMWDRREAARVFHICMTGWDAEPAFSVERSTPTRRTMRAHDAVPGAPAFAETAYDALLALAWVARDARDIQQRLDRLVEGAVLMRALLRGASQ